MRLLTAPLPAPSRHCRPFAHLPPPLKTLTQQHKTHSRPPHALPGHLAVVNYLLSEGAKIEQRSVMGETALVWVPLGAGRWVCAGRDCAAPRLHPANLHTINLFTLHPHTRTINSRAAHNGHLAVVERLLAAGARLDAADLGANTALHWAAMRGHVEVVRALVVAGADRSAANAQGRTPLDLCDPQWSLSWRFTREALAAGA